MGQHADVRIGLGDGRPVADRRVDRFPIGPPSVAVERGQTPIGHRAVGRDQISEGAVLIAEDGVGLSVQRSPKAFDQVRVEARKGVGFDEFVETVEFQVVVDEIVPLGLEARVVDQPIRERSHLMRLGQVSDVGLVSQGTGRQTVPKN